MKSDWTTRRLKLRMLVFGLLSLGMIYMDSSSTQLQLLRSVLFMAVKPIIVVAELPSEFVRDFQYALEDRESLRARNLEIIEENEELRERLIALKNEEMRSKWLTELLEAKEKVAYPTISANLTSVQLHPLSHKVVIDRGSMDSAFIGQPVLDHHGVIGQVTEVTLTDSAITLITDPRHSIPVRIQRNGILAVAHGLGVPNQMSISGIKVTQDVNVGDIFVTSGLGDRFPVGYPVAEVISVNNDRNTPFAEIIAAPLAVLDPQFEILMVWNKSTTALGDNSNVTMNDSGEQ